MTEAEYYREVKRFGLFETVVPTVYMTKDKEPYNVPLAVHQTPEQRSETIRRLRTIIGME